MRINPLLTNVLGFVPHHATRSEFWELERIPLPPVEYGNETNPENFFMNHLPYLPKRKILSKLDWENLKNCRLVCTAWDRLLRETYLNEKAICLVYPPVNYWKERVYTNNDVLTIERQTSIQPLSTSLLKDGKLEFSTLRWKCKEEFEYLIDNLLADLSFLKLGLECVTRLEIISGDWSKNIFVPINHSQYPGFIHKIMETLNNVTELIILDPEEYKAFIAPHNFDPLEWDPEYYRNRCESGEHYMLELKNLVEFYYSMDMIQRMARRNSMDFLLIVANSCTQLVKFHIELDYSMIWADDETLVNIYWLIGLILKNNAGSLKNVHIGTRNVFETDDVLMGEPERDTSGFGPGYPTSTHIEVFLEGGNWVKEYFRFGRNQMFEKLLDTIWAFNWNDFGMNVLEYLTIAFPLPVFPTEKINLYLKPFLQSLRNLKMLKIQPIFGTRTPSGNGYIPLPYFSDIFSNFGRDYSYSPIFVSDVIFYSDNNHIDWTSFQENRQCSTLDLVLKTKRGELKERSLHWRNVSWKNVTFGNSIVVSHLRQLTRLVIHQNKHYPRNKILTLFDFDFQMILRDGKSLQRLILNCDLGNVTPFGYSGLPFECLSFMRKFFGMYTNPTLGHSILDLKGLSCLCLIGLKGHEPDWTQTTHELTNANFEFLQKYFSNSDQVKFLILGLDGVTRVRRIDKFGSNINYSYTN